MITPDEEIRVIALPREWRYWLTPEGEAALDESPEEPRVRLTAKGLELARELEHKRAVADEARELAQQRASAARDRNDAREWLEEQAAQSQLMDGDAPDSL